jgi:hypothetical protein
LKFGGPAFAKNDARAFILFIQGWSGAMSALESRPAADDYRRALKNLENYLTCASLIFRSFPIEAKRPIFWRTVLCLLDSPDQSVTFGDLRRFLRSNTRRSYSDYLIQVALLAANSEDKPFLDLEPDPNHDRAAISALTRLKLTPRFFDSIGRYGEAFRNEFAKGKALPHDAVAIYRRVNGFLRDDYSFRWERLVARIAGQGSLLGHRSKDRIEENLNNYTSVWVFMNFLWAQTLRERLGESSAFLTREEIYRRLNKITAVPHADLDRLIPFLRDDLGFVEMRLDGKPVYGMAGGYGQLMWEFIEETGPLLENLLTSLVAESR